MIKFKFGKKIIYIEDINSINIIHYVADSHFLIYLEKRKKLPELCRLFSTVKARNQCVEEQGIIL